MCRANLNTSDISDNRQDTGRVQTFSSSSRYSVPRSRKVAPAMQRMRVGGQGEIPLQVATTNGWCEWKDS